MNTYKIIGNNEGEYASLRADNLGEVFQYLRNLDRPIVPKEIYKVETTQVLIFKKGQ
jgi:hypothetical protein